MKDAYGSAKTEEYPFVIFNMDESIYGVSSTYVLSIDRLGDTTPLQNAPEYSMGMTSYRGKTINLVSLRKLLGKPIRGEGRRVAMERNHAEHEQWMNEIESAVRVGRVPDVPLDVHSCELGRWIRKFRSKSHSLRNHVEKMTLPHRLLHESAAEIAVLMANGKQEEAIHQLDKLKATHYTQVLHLIDTTVSAYLADVHDMLIVMTDKNMTKGIVVDQIIGVEYIDRFSGLPKHTEQTPYVRQLAERGKNATIVMLLNETALVNL